MQKILRPIRSIYDYVRFFEIGLSDAPKRYVAVLIGSAVVTLLVSIFGPRAWGSYAGWAFPLFVLGLLLKFLSARWSPGRSSSYEFHQEETFFKAVQKMKVSMVDADNGHRFVPPGPGVHGGVVVSRDFNVGCMANANWDVPLARDMRGLHYGQILHSIRQHRAAFRAFGLGTVIKKLFDGKALINENKIGIGCDFSRDMTHVDVYKSSYLATWCSGDLAMKRIIEETPSGKKRIASLAIDRAPYDRIDGDLVLRPLSSSSRTVSAQIGINLLCVSKDKVLLIAIQGGKTMVGQNQRTPTASGSMDWEDVDGIETFKELGRVAALRELREEWGGNAERRKSGELGLTAFLPLGVFRVPDRSGKPEFAALGLMDWHEAELRADKTEVHEWEDQDGTDTVKHRYPVPTYAAFEAAVDELLTNEGDVRDTTPLFGVLTCLRDLMDASPETVKAALGYDD